MANVTAGTYDVDPISRIEGHLGVKVTVGAGAANITEANAHGNLWRGFENFLIGREVNDAITFTQRICGVCPLPHATASTFAVENVLGYNTGFITFSDEGANPNGVPKKAVLIRNLVYAAEFLMSHITHFYHLAAPSYVQGPPIAPWTPFYDDTQYSSYLISKAHGANADGTAATGVQRGVLPANAGNGFSKDLWSAVIKQYVKALRIRRLTFEAGALFAGRMPMTSSFVAGGVTNRQETDPAEIAKFELKCDKFRGMLEEVAFFIVREYVPLVLALSALYPAWDNDSNTGGLNYGAGVKNMLSWGCFPGYDGANHVLKLNGAYTIDGVTTGGPVPFMTGLNSVATAVPKVQANLVEFIAGSHYAMTSGFDADKKAYPGDVDRTKPDRDTGYSWLKAPRWGHEFTAQAWAAFGTPFDAGRTAIKKVVVKLDGVATAASNYTVDSAAGTITWVGAAPVGTLTVDYTVFYPMEVGPFARLVTNGIYPTDGTTALASALPFYVHADADGLDARCIHPDLAYALVAESLATATGLVESGTGDSARFTAGKIQGTIWTHISTLTGGFSTMDRLRGRAIEAFLIAQWMIGNFDKVNNRFGDGTGTTGWIGELKPLANASGFTARAVPTATQVSGFGVSEAPRGALAHFCTMSGGKIVRYQCVVPTTWNGSPKDGTTAVNANNTSATKRGPIEQAMIGVPFESAVVSTNYTGGTALGYSAESGIEVLRVAQSFDPCIACAVH